jgi:hypothetical protein
LEAKLTRKRGCASLALADAVHDDNQMQGSKETTRMMLNDLKLDVAPLIMGAIHMGLAAAGGLFERGTLKETLQHTACNADVIRAISDYVLDAVASTEDPELNALLDTIETLVLQGRADRLLQ